MRNKSTTPATLHNHQFVREVYSDKLLAIASNNDAEVKAIANILLAAENNKEIVAYETIRML